jgi:hypothetical protein
MMLFSACLYFVELDGSRVERHERIPSTHENYAMVIGALGALLVSACEETAKTVPYPEL